jgi:hypothetical protein
MQQPTKLAPPPSPSTIDVPDSMPEVTKIKCINPVTCNPGKGADLAQTFSAKEGVAMRLHKAGVLITGAKSMLVPWSNLVEVWLG